MALSLLDLFWPRDEQLYPNPHNWMTTDIKNEESQYVTEIALPGVKEENIKITIDNGYLNIKATYSSENKTSKYQGSLTKSYRLPRNVDTNGIQANFNDGLLSLTIPKKEVTQYTIPINGPRQELLEAPEE